ncbi:MAG: glucokinase [Candidatus Nanoarchaeia archaeon]
MNEQFLLFDVGGTWTRYAFSDGKKLISPKEIPTPEFKLEDIKNMIQNSGKKISLIIISAAGPVINGKCKMTNANLVFDERTLSMITGTRVKVVNDFVAAAHALKKEKGLVVLGPGTGLGVGIITNKGEIFPSEEGHLKIKRDLFLSIPEFNHVNLPEYEQALAGKNNILLKIFKKEKLTLGKDRLTEIYKEIFELFLQEMLIIHKNKGIKKIILRGGVIAGNKKFFSDYSKTLKKKFKVDIKIIIDDFLGLKGTMEFCRK